jgi:4-amino-4-deoxy-L-arabinose transferase-like glycosyltransferase
MSRARGLLLILGVWCAIYLPGLGTLEIKGEEGRRILPAAAMLQTRNFLVPHVGSDPYFAKPPLVNWLVAASFKLFAQRNEWAARIPSALCVLAVALAFATIARSTLGANGSLIGALVWLTNFGMIEKGRLIEIEALYASLCGLAVIGWLSWWQEGRSKWLTWVVPWIFLGLGLLAKGPLHLIFFYAVVLAVLYRAGELRMLWNSAHLLGLILMVGIFAAWAIPCLRVAQESSVTQTWAHQFSGRLSGEDFKLSGWLLNIPRGLCYFLPWTILFAFARRARCFQSERTSSIAKGLLLGIAVSFLGISLLPGSLARYTMPLLVPAAWLVAMLLTSDTFELPRWLQFHRLKVVPKELRLPVVWSALVCLAIAIYAFALMPALVRREKVRNIAAQLNAALPPGEPLYALDPDYQPFLFYVRNAIVYIAKPAALPREARFILVQRRDEEQVASMLNRKAPESILRIKDYRGKEVTLLKPAGEDSP